MQFFNGIEISYYTSGIPGDANGDCKVNAADAERLAANWNSGNAKWWMGDFTGDGLVNDIDATILAANWGYSTSEVMTVPEPSVLMILVIGFTGLTWLHTLTFFSVPWIGRP